MIRGVVSSFLAIWSCAAPLYSADIEFIGGPICDLSLTGMIDSGDADLLEPYSYEVAPYTLCLDSEGGDFSEGLSLFRLIWDGNINTVVLPGDQCLSACALAFMGGSNVQGTDSTRQIERAIFPGARLGFHGPFLDFPDAPIPGEVVEQAFWTAMQSARLLFEMNQLQERSGYGISDFLYGVILNTPADDLYIISTVGDLIAADIWPAGVSPVYPAAMDGGASVDASLKTAIKNACINMYVAAPPEDSYFTLADSSGEHFSQILDPFGPDSRFSESELTVELLVEADGSVVGWVYPFFSGSKYGDVECFVIMSPGEIFEAPVGFDKVSPTGFWDSDPRLRGALRYAEGIVLETPWPDRMMSSDIPFRSVPFWYVYHHSTPIVQLPQESGVAGDAEWITGEQALLLTEEQRRRIQSSLESFGFYEGLIDGDFGPQTREALRAWQGERGLPPTGYLDAQQFGILDQRAMPTPFVPRRRRASEGSLGLEELD